MRTANITQTDISRAKKGWKQLKQKEVLTYEEYT